MKNNTILNLEQLTWLRGLAALFVLLSHINRTNEGNYIGEVTNEFLLLKILDFGSFGVALFFTLSGCTLYLSASRNGFKNINSCYQFLIKRFLRIWPAFAFSLIAYIIAGEIFNQFLLPYQGDWIARQFLNPFTTIDVLNYLFLVFNFTGPSELFNNAYWSLPVEFQYYLTLPLIYIILNRFGFAGLVVTIAISHLFYKTTFGLIESTLVFRLFFTFCLGLYAGYIFTKIKFRIRSSIGLILLFFVITLVYFFNEGYFKNLPLPSEWVVYGILAVLAVFIAVLTEISLSKKLSAILSFYGDISYSLYLFHNLILMISVIIFVYFQSWLAPFKLLFICTFSIIFSTIIAWLSYKFIESPSIRLGRNLTK